jgi:two-component system sensor histidine kinase RegB
MRWFVTMRWHLAFAEIVALSVGKALLGSPITWGWISALVGLQLVSNATLEVALRRKRLVHRTTAASLVLADALLLTTLLALAGPEADPFAMLYLGLVAIAAFVLEKKIIVAVFAVMVIGFGAVIALGSAPRGPRYAAYVTLVALALVTASTVRRLATAVRTRQEALVRAEHASTRAEAVASLGALAAGAAHELSTPLGTIALAAADLDALVELSPERAAADAALIREQVERCRAIITRMTGRAGDRIGELPSEVVLSQLHEELRAALSTADRPRFDSDLEARPESVRVPRAGLVQSLVSLIANGMSASREHEGRVVLRADIGTHEVCFRVEDDGPGIAPDIYGRLGDPFVTTKPPGQGMGLGIFLCRAFTEAWNGALAFECPNEGGTRAILRLPVKRTS